MTKVYLFDWGDTLMTDFPNQQGKMCNWTEVQAVEGALETLAKLSVSNSIYVATNAADSSASEIKSAFERVGLAKYIKSYFCTANLGIGKGSPDFFHKIVQHLEVSPSSVIMVGDSFDNDIAPAVTAGIGAIWFNQNATKPKIEKGFIQINHLREVCNENQQEILGMILSQRT